MQLEEAIVGVVCGGCMVVWRGPLWFWLTVMLKSAITMSGLQKLLINNNLSVKQETCKASQPKITLRKLRLLMIAFVAMSLKIELLQSSCGSIFPTFPMKIAEGACSEYPRETLRPPAFLVATQLNGSLRS